MKNVIVSLFVAIGMTVVLAACGPTDPEPETSGPAEVCDRLCVKYCSNSCGGDYPCIKNCNSECGCN